MNWIKLGKIFDPRDHELPNGCTEFAQSPSVLVFNDFVRIYFSTRKTEKASGKYLSFIAYVDMDKKIKNILSVSSHTVIPLGCLGGYDEHGIFPLSVMRYGDRILGYIGGWSRRVSVSVETSIGLAYSEDNGLTFRRIGDGPVLSASLHEPYLVGDPFVAVFGGIYHMYYIYGVRWIDSSREDPQRVYKIGHATSKDGIVWCKDGRQLIDDKLDSDECQALPTVVQHADLYHMFFCHRHATDFRTNPERGYRIGYAFSTDLLNWTRDDSGVGIDVSMEGWDSEMLCYPHVFHYDDNLYMLYNGNAFGRYGFGLAVLANDGE